MIISLHVFDSRQVLAAPERYPGNAFPYRRRAEAALDNSANTALHPAPERHSITQQTPGGEPSHCILFPGRQQQAGIQEKSNSGANT
jgi:hypothetical protein